MLKDLRIKNAEKLRTMNKNNKKVIKHLILILGKSRMFKYMSENLLGNNSIIRFKLIYIVFNLFNIKLNY
jgi:hypothetical protein